MGKEKLMELPFFLLFLLRASCQSNFKKPVDTLFQSLPSSETGVRFNNKLTTDDSVNVLSYEYLYNGGGVGIADFNKDSLPDIFFLATWFHVAFTSTGKILYLKTLRKSQELTQKIFGPMEFPLSTLIRMVGRTFTFAPVE